MTRAAVSAGSNLGQSEQILERALDELAATAGLTELARSPYYLTAPVGYTAQPWFVNACALLQCELEPYDLLARVQDLELSYGRERSFKNAPRTLDLDIIAISGVQMQEERLILPHPRAAERAFVLVPLNDIAPDLTLQQGGPTVAQLLKALPPEELNGVKRIERRDRS
ncbi:MAG: 2-amino-4-hydroxy-6-hydroxymethyldihydropteridine diphosphokinase [Succinivibrio sp.]|nr:2-amino-4-hydroxy-6-hydroxymethyldihydropteridine diphosphokinase [Succinivibrio sp.]